MTTTSHSVTNVRFISIPYSPWSEKARWALQHRGVQFTRETFMPGISGPLLRIRLMRPFARVGAPMLIANGSILADSFDIAKFAESVGSGVALIPPAEENVIKSWNDKSERLLSAARALSLRRMRLDKDAQIEAMPPFVPSGIANLLVPIATHQINSILRKYGSERGDVETYESECVRVLDDLSNALRDSKSKYLLGTFTYADIAMATSLQFIKPVDDKYIKLGLASRRIFTHSGLAEKYPHLIEWRDALYTQRRLEVRR